MNGIVIACLQPSEPLVEAINDLCEEVSFAVTRAHVFWHGVVLPRRLVFLSVPGMLDEPRAKERHNRHRNNIRTEERNDYCKCQRREKVLAHTCEKRYGEENDRSAHGCSQHC